MPSDTQNPPGPVGPDGAAGASVLHCLLVLNDTLIMQDIAEGLAEVFPCARVLCAQSLDEAEAHLKTATPPVLAILDDRETGVFSAPLAAALAAVGAVIAVIGRGDSASGGASFPALDSPYGYGDLQDFLSLLRDMLGR